MAEVLIVSGLVLFLLGLLTGMAVPATRNPRMAVASHLQGMTNGPFLIVVGLMWSRVHLPGGLELAAAVLLVYSTYANWLATQLGALWGAGSKFAPHATGDHRGSDVQEAVVNLLLVSLAPAIVVATLILIVGVLR